MFNMDHEVALTGKVIGWNSSRTTKKLHLYCQFKHSVRGGTPAVDLAESSEKARGVIVKQSQALCYSWDVLECVYHYMVVSEAGGLGRGTHTIREKK